MPVLLLLLLASVAVEDCGFMRVDVPAGAIVSEAEIVRGSCPADAVPAKLRYDGRRGVAVARHALTEGEALGRVYLPRRPDVLPGDSVALVARIGHVVVRRDMTALQTARANQRYFVRDEEGQVLLAPELARSEQP